MWCCRVIGLILLLLIAAPAWADREVSGVPQDTRQPIDIRSQSLILKMKERVAMFRDDVHVMQDTMELDSQKMDVYYHDDLARKTSKSSIYRIDAYGGVEITTPERTGTSEKAVYDVEKKLVTMEENVVIRQDGSVLRGEKFTYDLQTGAGKMFSSARGKTNSKNGEKASSGRVKGLFVPKGKPEKAVEEKDEPRVELKKTTPSSVPASQRVRGRPLGFVPVPVAKPAFSQN